LSVVWSWWVQGVLLGRVDAGVIVTKQFVLIGAIGCSCWYGASV